MSQRRLERDGRPFVRQSAAGPGKTPAQIRRCHFQCAVTTNEWTGGRDAHAKNAMRCNACLLGGGSEGDDATESGYFAARALLAQSVGQATRHIAQRGLIADGAPALVRLLAVVAARYKVQLTQKAAGMLVPGIGAAAGAAINLMFIDHFQTVSRGHFTIRRLERKYGEMAVRHAWTGLALPAPSDAPPHLSGA